MAEREHDRRGSTSAQLRHDIDSGRTGAKVPYPDPAAAPLGTDEEAAGTPPTAAQIDHARQAERAATGQRDPIAAVGRHGGRDARRLTWGLVAAAVVAVLMVVLIAA